MTLEPPEPPLVDDALRLVPVEPRHEAGIDALLGDEDGAGTPAFRQVMRASDRSLAGEGAGETVMASR
jgi:hypothetical protein